MTEAELLQGQALQKTIDLIEGVQASIASSGAKASLIIVDAKNQILVSEDKLKEAIGETAYNAIVATAKTSLTTELTDTKTEKEGELALL